MTITQFLTGRTVERQAVQRYISRHPEAFEGHIDRSGKEMQLDDEAIRVLEDVYPLPSMVEVIPDYESRDQLLVAQQEIIVLQRENIAMQRSHAAEKDQLRQELTDLRAQTQAQALALEDRHAALDAKDAVIAAKDEAIAAKDAEIADLKDQLEREKSRSWWKKLIGR